MKWSSKVSKRKKRLKVIIKILTSASHMLLDIELYKKLWHSSEKDTGKGATVSEKYLNIQSSQSDFFL